MKKNLLNQIRHIIDGIIISESSEATNITATSYIHICIKTVTETVNCSWRYSPAKLYPEPILLNIILPFFTLFCSLFLCLSRYSRTSAKENVLYKFHDFLRCCYHFFTIVTITWPIALYYSIVRYPTFNQFPSLNCYDSIILHVHKVKLSDWSDTCSSWMTSSFLSFRLISRTL